MFKLFRSEKTDAYLVVGLGNPGKKYERTRHNVGFETLDIFMKNNGFAAPSKKFKALIGSGTINGHKVYAVKPMTFMNLSGEAVRKIVNYYGIDVVNRLIVISDEINLDPGRIRIRKKGSAGGHNGLKNIIENLGTEDFTRIRIGVGGRQDGNLVDHVLSPFSRSDRKLVDEAESLAADAAEMIIKDGADAAMNRYN